MFQNRRVRTIALAIATAVAVPAVGLTAAGVAQADNETKAAPIYKGKVIAKKLMLRTHPTTASATEGFYTKGEVVNLSCKVKTISVDGNRLWYRLAYLQGGWISARYVTNVGKAPRWCDPDAYFAKGSTTKKPSVNLRSGPTNKAKLAGKLKYSTKVHVLCKLNGPKVGGNPRWYQLTDGKWVSARYVKNVGKAPRYWDEPWL
ncbi:SH3 domain-containing protein [Tenggerimyces flavus]|uniref:SH3 domain-containing protein n=1 Tax=Tenggerimyces flavus TaxID=1708749 RepID=A0ABV7Y816_9ACTN|nr:SH3 domain-containing protein [Tenggerimyces flavus]MBM7785230.1 uncharacterized protein YgiM (DUF1202 family) [Tenggerimyces flavus]